jgi:N utilization substance protein A
MSKALIAGINQVAIDKGLDREVIFEAIEAALVSAYKRNFGPVANVTAEVDRYTGEMRVLTEREVVDDVISERTEITERMHGATHPRPMWATLCACRTRPSSLGASPPRPPSR